MSFALLGRRKSSRFTLKQFNTTGHIHTHHALLPCCCQLADGDLFQPPRTPTGSLLFVAVRTWVFALWWSMNMCYSVVWRSEDGFSKSVLPSTSQRQGLSFLLHCVLQAGCPWIFWLSLQFLPPGGCWDYRWVPLHLTFFTRVPVIALEPKTYTTSAFTCWSVSQTSSPCLMQYVDTYKNINDIPFPSPNPFLLSQSELKRVKGRNETSTVLFFSEKGLIT